MQEIERQFQRGIVAGLHEQAVRIGRTKLEQITQKNDLRAKAFEMVTYATQEQALIAAGHLISQAAKLAKEAKLELATMKHAAFEGGQNIGREHEGARKVIEASADFVIAGFDGSIPAGREHTIRTKGEHISQFLLQLAKGERSLNDLNSSDCL